MVRNGISGGEFLEVQEPQTLIVAPTRELVMQIYEEARKFAHGTIIRPVVLYGGTSTSYQLGQLRKGAQLVVGTPGRLIDVIEKGKVSSNPILIILTISLVIIVLESFSRSLLPNYCCLCGLYYIYTEKFIIQ